MKLETLCYICYYIMGIFKLKGVNGHVTSAWF
jgi:hypothetical protein